MNVMTERDKCAHVLRRFGFGASEAELDYYSKNGLSGAIELLLNGDQIEEELPLNLEIFENDKNVINVNQLPGWLCASFLTTRRPLVEKMVLFWHNHFATSGDKVTQARVLGPQIEIFRSKGLGKFEELLLSVSRDPAMLIWLDGQDNIKGRPNENFAREIMELFTLGEGHYSERDIQEAARAFTGWSFNRSNRAGKRGTAEYMFKPKLHDDSIKTVLGKTGRLTGEDVIAHLCAQPRTSEFIAAKIWKWFASDEPTPSTLKSISKTFFDSGLEIKALLRAIMTTDEFYSPKVVRRLIKNPVDFCCVTMRSLGMGEKLLQDIREAVSKEDDNKKARLAMANVAASAMKNQGMWLLFPPDVSGWKPGEAWITSATMVERMNWASRLMGVSSRGNVTRYPIYNLLAADPTPFGIAQKLCSVFDAPIQGPKLAKLAEAAQKSLGKEGLTPRNANQVAASVVRLIFGSPEFQFA
jgi:uncharacterized protein (DUF1800 family)